MRRTPDASALQVGLFDVEAEPKLPVRISVLLFLAGVICLAGDRASLAAEDPLLSGNWPAWRRDGSGISDEKGLPVFWSETENVRWRTGLPGEGDSSPIVWGKRVFLTAALDDGAQRLVLCFDADNGKLLWKTELLPDAKTLLYPKTGFAAPTPATDGERIYVFFDTPGLVALDMRGKVVWNRRLGPFQSPYNVASSPILYRDMVIQCCDHPGPSFVAAFSARDGQPRWRTPRRSSSCGHFGTPLVIQAQGRPQLVINAEPIVAYDPDTGKEIGSAITSLPPRSQATARSTGARSGARPT